MDLNRDADGSSYTNIKSFLNTCKGRFKSSARTLDKIPSAMTKNQVQTN